MDTNGRGSTAPCEGKCIPAKRNRLRPRLHPCLSAFVPGLAASLSGLRSSIPLLSLAAVCLGVAGDLHWENGPGYRSASLLIPKEGRNGFARVPGLASGILFTNLLSRESGVRTQLRLA